MTISADIESGTRANRKLFLACFVALVATSFVFGVRSTLIGEWQAAFNLTETDKGTILGVGLWPFALSIIVFSLIIDTIGYKVAAMFAIGCHLVSIALTLTATGFRSLYWSTFLVAVGNGMVEAFINPVVATLFSKEKAKWLNILHAGWPAGLALGALFTQCLGAMSWETKYAMCFLPVVAYAVLILPRKFPLNERVAAGVSYLDMLKEVGAIGFFMIGWLFTAGIGQMANVKLDTGIISLIAAVIAVVAGLATKSMGRPMFLLILLAMGPLATTELGTDSWMTDLLKYELGDKAPWIFIYISIVMTALRCGAGPIVERFSPIGLLALSAAVAICGLLFLWQAAGMVLILAATVYAFGKTFLWSTTLGMVSEQFPRGGALTLNGVSAVGVLGMGIIGAPLMGLMQARHTDELLKEKHPAIHQVVAGPAVEKLFGLTEPTLKTGAEASLSAVQQKSLEEVTNTARKASFARVAVLPGFLLVCYLLMWAWFRSKGGYRPVEIGA